jgi:hypothetical protein
MGDKKKFSIGNEHISYFIKFELYHIAWDILFNYT